MRSTPRSTIIGQLIGVNTPGEAARGDTIDLTFRTVEDGAHPLGEGRVAVENVVGAGEGAPDHGARCGDAGGGFRQIWPRRSRLVSD